MNRIFLLVLIVLSITTTLHAQPPYLLWQSYYGGNEMETCEDINQAPDGGFVMVGTRNLAISDLQYLIIKVSSTGLFEWETIIGDDEIDHAFSLCTASDGGYLVVGYSQSFSSYGGDIYAVKIDEQGNSVWEEVYGGDYYDTAYSVETCSDGGYIIGGKTDSFGAGFGDMYLIKIDGSGQQEWQSTFGGMDDETCWSVKQTSDGGYILAGNSYSVTGGSGTCDVFLVKTDATGNFQWQQSYGGGMDEICYEVEQTADGGYVLGCETDSFGSGYSDFWLVKTDEHGEMQWQQRYGGFRWRLSFSWTDLLLWTRWVRFLLCKNRWAGNSGLVLLLWE